MQRCHKILSPHISECQNKVVETVDPPDNQPLVGAGGDHNAWNYNTLMNYTYVEKPSNFKCGIFQTKITVINCIISRNTKYN